MEQKLEAFKGIKVNSLRRELEIPDPTFLRTAKNVVVGNDGSLYAHTGNIIRSNPSADLHRVFYSKALNRYLTANGRTGDIKVYSIDVNGAWSVTATHAAKVPEGSTAALAVPFTVQLADWALTSAAYMISNSGTDMQKLTTNGTTIAAVALGGTISPPTVMCVHKDTLWLAKGNVLYPSDDLTPETFDTANSITISKGETYITGLASMGGVLYVHKWDCITAIIGDTFVGTSADVALVDVDVSVGTIGPDALKVFRGMQWFQGPGGYYVFNGEKTKLLSDRLLLQPIRKLA